MYSRPIVARLSDVGLTSDRGAALCALALRGSIGLLLMNLPTMAVVRAATVIS